MTTKVRAVRFEASLLDELEGWLARDGQDLSRFVNAAVVARLQRPTEGGAPTAPRVVPDLAAAAEEYRRALLAREGRRAQGIVEGVVARGAPIIDVYCDVLAQTLEEIGDLWALDEINVAQEHYATEVTVQVLSALAPDRHRTPTVDRTAVIAASRDELHDLGARMVAAVLQRAGWHVIALGAAAPADALAELVAADRPDLVALSTSTVGRLPGVEQAIAELRALDPAPVIAVGGALYRGPVIDLVRSWGAAIVVNDLRQLPAELARHFPAA
jgi:methanogenic corrinoid protein MtbC1